MPESTSEEFDVEALEEIHLNEVCMKADITGWQNLDREAKIEALHEKGVHQVNVVTTTDVVNTAVEVDLPDDEEAEGDELENEDDLESMTVEELRELAAEDNISGRSSMNKQELIDALRGE